MGAFYRASFLHNSSSWGEFVAEGVWRDSLDGHGGRSQGSKERVCVACCFWWANKVLLPCVAAASHVNAPPGLQPLPDNYCWYQRVCCRQDRNPACLEPVRFDSNQMSAGVQYFVLFSVVVDRRLS